jgi:predicted nucleic acid-binding protein
MSKRLQVILKDPEYREIQRMAVRRLYKKFSIVTSQSTGVTRSSLHLTLCLVWSILPVEQSAAERAKTIVLGSRQLSARDALHLAIMQEHGIEQILSFDTGFDGFPGITRLS